MNLFLRQVVGLILTVTLVAANAGNSFVPVELSRGVHIELPTNWTALSDSKRTTLAAYAQAQVERLNANETDVEMPFAANLYDDAGLVAASINIRYYPALTISQSDAARSTTPDVNELDIGLQKTVIPGAESGGQRVLAWRGTKKTNINGVIAFVSEYLVSAPKGGPFVVALVRVYNLKKSFTLILSYRENNALLEPIISRVIRTLQVK
jgi:hypothetical protein